MPFDYFVFLQTCESLEDTPVAWALAGGFVDHVSNRFLEAEIEIQTAERANDRDRRRQGKKKQGKKKQEKEKKKTELRGQYKDKTSFRFPISLYPCLHPDFSSLPCLSWLAFQVDFELLTPWYSKDDRVFHLLDNPVRKDRVFGVPFMAASSWKGMLRWACRMQAGLRKHLERNNGTLDGWRDPDWILHLFGHEKGEKEHGQLHQGALVFYPTWFDRISFEVINPHSRQRRAGTQPIYYEVVPPGGKGTLSLLYAPWPLMKPEAKPEEVLPRLLEAIEALLTTCGISAKRTVGWGTAKILKWRAYHKTHSSGEKNTRHDLWKEVQSWLTKGGAP